MAFTLKKLFQIGDDALKKGSVVGVDIGSSAIKVVEIKSGNEGAELVTYGEIALGPYANADIGRAVDLEPKKLTEALVDIVRESGVKGRSAALSIPYTASFVSVIEIPTKDQAQLASMIPVEARKYVPTPMNEVTLDWFIIPENPAHTAVGTQVLLAAIHNEALKQYRSVVQNSGLLAGFSEIEAFSTLRSCAHEEDTIVMVLDMGASSTKLYILESGIIHATHRILLGAQDITTAIAEALSIPLPEAEEAKRHLNITAEDADVRARDAVLSVLERIFSEMQRVVARYESDSGMVVETVVLSGGGALLGGSSDVAAEFFKKTIRLADPFTKIAYPAFLTDTLKEAGPSFAVALGIALRKLSE